MNDQFLADTIRAALGNIVECAPGPAPWPVRSDGFERSSMVPRWIVPVAASAVGVAGVTGVVLVGGSDTDAPGIGAPATVGSVPSTAPPIAVIGEPTCGDQLPVMISAGRTSGPLPGPAVPIQQASGQYVEHWQFDGGTIEFRWPADEPVLYDLDGDFGARPALLPYAPSFSPGVGDEGVYFVGLVQQRMSSDGVTVETIVPQDGGLDGELFGLEPAVSYAVVAGWTPTDPVVQSAPCDVLQVRYVEPTGAFSTWGYPLTELGRLGAAWTPIDLQPLIAGSGEVSDPPTVYECPGVDLVRGSPFGDLPPAPSAADALRTFLGTYDARYFAQSGYRELLVKDGDVYYAQYAAYDDSMITMAIDVQQRADGTWAVAGWEGTCG